MMELKLDERKKQILYAVVSNYILSAEPVSSQTITDKYQIGVSPATVRHEMGLLEEMGYLKQPHTSAGRIPTDIGYRFYVDNLTDIELNPIEQVTISRLFATISKEIEDLMKETSVLLSRMTSYTGIVFAPLLRRSTFKHLDLIYLNPHTILMVLITDTGCVDKELVQMRKDVSAEILTEMEQELNSSLARLNLDQIRNNKQRVLRESVSDKTLLKEIFERIIDLMDREESERIFLGGTSYILQQPEFEDIEKVQGLLEALEQRYVILYLLKEAFNQSQVFVRIGVENRRQEMKDCSIVAAKYRFAGRDLGTLGIIGPTRMDYARAISMVKYFARTLSEVLESLHN